MDCFRHFGRKYGVVTKSIQRAISLLPSKNERNPRRLAANKASYDSFAICSADVRACGSQIAAVCAAEALCSRPCNFCGAWAAAARCDRCGLAQWSAGLAHCKNARPKRQGALASGRTRTRSIEEIAARHRRNTRIPRRPSSSRSRSRPPRRSSARRRPRRRRSCTSP